MAISLKDFQKNGKLDHVALAKAFREETGKVSLLAKPRGRSKMTAEEKDTSRIEREASARMNYGPAIEAMVGIILSDLTVGGTYSTGAIVKVVTDNLGDSSKEVVKLVTDELKKYGQPRAGVGFRMTSKPAAPSK